MKRPNGTGTVIKLSGKRRKPYAVRITETLTFEDGKAKQVRRFVGYYEKQEQANDALSKYNQAPVDEKPKAQADKKPIFSEIYNLFLEDLSKRPTPLSKSSMDGYRSAYDKFEPLHAMVFEKITVTDYENIAKKYAEMSHSTIKSMKLLVSQLYKTGMRYGYVNYNLADNLMFYALNEKANPHISFTDDEIEALWANKCDFVPSLLLILIYTGVRIRELLNMKCEDVHLEDRYMVGGNKTAAGKGRMIPISEKIVPLLDTRGKYLIKYGGSHLSYDKAHSLLKEYMEDKEVKHKFHDTRHTTLTLLEKAGVDERHIKLIAGHASGDVTDRYIHISIEQLIEDINKI